MDDFRLPSRPGRARPILLAPHKLLQRKAKPVDRREIQTPLFAQLIADMFATIAANNLVGMAAPQIGVSLALIAVDLTDDGRRFGPYAIINPKLEKLGDELLSTEGSPCLPGLAAEIVRAGHVICTGIDGLTGEKLCLDATGMLAICLQHEVDHLHGRLINNGAERTFSMSASTENDETALPKSALAKNEQLSAPPAGSPMR